MGGGGEVDSRGGFVCDGAVEFIIYEGGPSVAEVQRQAEELFPPGKCAELKLLDTCGDDGDASDCPRLTE